MKGCGKVGESFVGLIENKPDYEELPSVDMMANKISYEKREVSMDAWQPPPLPNGQTQVDLLSIYRFKQFLDWDFPKLLNTVESLFSPRSAGDIFDDLGNFVETWIRKKLRTWSGGDISEFTIFNPNIITGAGKPDHYFQGVNRVICGDESVRIYLQNLLTLPPVEQAIWINILLNLHPDMKKLYYGRKGLTIEVSVLMYRIGLEKFGVC